MNKITVESIGKELFDLITDDYVETSYREHRRGSNFYTKCIFIIDDSLLPEHPELWGYWESNTFVFDTEYGRDNGDIYELTRVEKKTRTVVTEYWVEVE